MQLHCIVIVSPTVVCLDKFPMPCTIIIIIIIIITTIYMAQ